MLNETRGVTEPLASDAACTVAAARAWSVTLSADGATAEAARCGRVAGDSDRDGLKA